MKMQQESEVNKMTDDYRIAVSEVWSQLSSINVNAHVEEKFGLSYLSWAWAYAIMMKNFPTFEYRFFSPEAHDDGSVTVHCEVSVIHRGHVITRQMWLPVMDFKNRAIAGPDACAINKTKMRCMTKAISMLGLGSYIYAGQDLPELDDGTLIEVRAEPEKKQQPAKQTQKKPVEHPDIEDASIFTDEPVDDDEVEILVKGDAGEIVLNTEDDANQAADLIIELAKMHSKDLSSLVDFWKTNLQVITHIENGFPEQFERLKAAFTEIKSKLKEA